MDRQRVKLEKLLPLYIFTVFLTIILVGPPHLFPPPSFMPFRFPHYLETMNPFLGIAWPLTFKIYHLILLSIAIVYSLNLLAITIPKWRKIGKFSSFLGTFLIIPVIVFLFAQFTKVNLSTAIIYGSISILFLIINILTFNLLAKKSADQVRRKEE